MIVSVFPKPGTGSFRNASVCDALSENVLLIATEMEKAFAIRQSLESLKLST